MATESHHHNARGIAWKSRSPQKSRAWKAELPAPPVQPKRLNLNSLGSNISEAKDLLDFERLSRICGESGIIELVMEFLHHTEELLEQLKQAHAIRDHSARRRIAHEIKGSAGALSMKKMMELSNAMQLLEPTEWEKSQIFLDKLIETFHQVKGVVALNSDQA